MKKISMLMMAALAVTTLSCNKELTDTTDETPGFSGAPALTARFSEEETKTAFVGGTFMWKKNDNMVVRSDNANGYTTYKYTGDDTADEVTFVPNTADDNIVYGQNSFALYPAKTSGSGASAYPKEEDGSLKPVLKDTYTWFEGDVEAPMLARVEAGEPLEFKHLGGCLKVTYKNVPPKATKIVVMAPVVDADLLAAGKVSYKICSTMNRTYNWTTEGGGFDPVEVPYVKAYDHSGTYTITINIASATAAQRTSDDGITAYIPMPVGPVVSGGQNVYPQLKVWLAFNDNTEVPGSLRTASNVQIERAHIKPMPAIVMPKYTVELVAGNTSYTAGANNGTGTAAKFNQVRGLCWKDNNTLALTESNNSGHIRLYNKNTKAVTTANSTNLGNAPWQAAMNGGLLYIANKGGNKIQSFNFSTSTASDVVTGMNNPMSICFVGSDAYVCEQAGQSLYKFEGGLTGTMTKLYDFSALDSYVDRAVCMKADKDGNLIVGLSISDANSKYFKIVVIAPNGTKLQEIGEGTKGTSFANLVDGGIDKAVFSAAINGMAIDSSGNIYVADNWAIRKITHTASDYSDAVVTTLLGNGSSFVTTTPSTLVKFGQVSDIAIDPDNENILYVMDLNKYVLTKVTIE